jgi:hypothetical protein
MSKKLFDRNVPGKLFKPVFRDESSKAGRYTKKPDNNEYKYEEFKDTNLYSTSSYRYGDKDYLVSNQQVRIDYSDFTNHTFFHSAVANVNEAFDRIVNFYPFDGTGKQLEEFEDTLTGFEKYVLDSFPGNVGYLVFSGTQKGEDTGNGNYIEVIDRSGARINAISRDRTGRSVLDPNTSPFTIEFWCKLPKATNDNQIICQKLSSLSNNFTLALSESNSTLSGNLVFGITSGSNHSTVTGTIDKGSFVHVACVYDPEGDQKTKLIIGDTVASSSQSTVFENLRYDANNLTIGTGVQSRVEGGLFGQQQTCDGSIDEFRFFHTARKKSIIKKENKKAINDYENLKLNFKFNEISGSHAGNNIVLDSSGYSLHSYVNNHDPAVSRVTGSDQPVSNDLPRNNPVLFPAYDLVKDLNTKLLTTASLYDDANPNLITKLIPPHYFEQGNDQEGFTEFLGKLNSEFSTFTNHIVGKRQSELPGVQLLVKFLLSWAKMFDELKIMIDSISDYKSVEYEDYDTVPDPLLQKRASELGIKLPSLFSGASMAQLIDGVNINENYANSTKTLNQIQNLIWRRILSDASNIKMSRGTIDTMKSVFRSSGIEPDNILSFREFGGSKVLSLEGSRELRRDVINFLNFSGSKDKIYSTADYQGYHTGYPRIKSGYLLGDRVEVGLPEPRGTLINQTRELIHGTSNNSSDGLFTSGSFTYEGLYDWEHGLLTKSGSAESLVRIHTTGSGVGSNIGEATIVNLVGTTNKLDLFISDSPTTNEVKNLYLTGVNIFDKDIWHVSFGRKAAHEMLDGSATSQYFLRAAKQHGGEVLEQYLTSSIYTNQSDSVFNVLSSTYNVSGSFIVIGNQNINNPANSSVFLNTTGSNATGGTVPALAHSSSFTGLVTNMLFWSKAITEDEWGEHIKNHGSVGTKNPLRNYNFSKNITGSFERLILQASSKQGTTGSTTEGNLRIFDFSQNDIHIEGSGFEASKNLFKPLRADYEVLSDKFDLNYAKTKIRIRSLQSEDLLTKSGFARIAPVYETMPSEEVVDDNRLSIDMSVMKGLNQNILQMFSDFSPMDDALGRPNLMFGNSYPDLIQYRKIYFNNLLEKVDLKKYRSLFKWIDNSFTDLLYSLTPRSTNFLGINFIYESHVLERNRFNYLSDEIYLKALPRDPSRGNLLLSQFVGRLDKF